MQPVIFAGCFLLAVGIVCWLQVQEAEEVESEFTATTLEAASRVMQPKLARSPYQALEPTRLPTVFPTTAPTSRPERPHFAATCHPEQLNLTICTQVKDDLPYLVTTRNVTTRNPATGGHTRRVWELLHRSSLC